MENKDSGTNFWISYADLMAGLLFVFILLIGAIIVKYSLLQSESKVLEQNLNEEKVALEKNQKELTEKKARIKDLEEIKAKYETTKKELKASLLKNEKLTFQIKEVRTKNSLQEKLIIENEEKLKVTISEKEQLALNIQNFEVQVKEKDEKLDSAKNLQKEIEEKLNSTILEKAKLIASIEELETLAIEKDKKLDELLEEVLLKKSMIKTFEEKNRLLDDEMKVMLSQLKDSKVKHNQLSKSLESTKQKIKSFTGIRVKVISELKKKLGKSIEIDPKNGSLRLSSNILFDEGKYTLKENSKIALKKAVYDYFKTVLDNEDINKHIDKLVIEGHTNSKGNYLYNLELSQKRAYSVMDFLLTLDFNKQDNLKKLISASGRSFLDPIYDENGKEDQDASRRIEIKLSLKNEQAIKEIANILE